MDNLKQDIELLHNEGCPFDPTDISNVKIWTIYDGCSDSIDPDDLAFHPDGQCGCCGVISANAFGIRCFHLMWLTGEHEYLGSDGQQCPRGVLLLGNHKGRLMIKYLCEVE
jgi:hypothetical protein